MFKQLARSLLFAFAYIYKPIQDRLDGALGAVCLSKVSNIGTNCIFEGDGRLIDPEKLTLGDEIYLGRNFFIRASGGIRIGSYTHISRNVTLHTVNHNTGGLLLPYDRTDILKPIAIGRYVWIGMNCSVLPGVTIGDGAIIGMNTVVSKDVEPNSIVVGPSQRVVGARDSDRTYELQLNQMFLRNEND